jgi:hypothetical protein
LTGDSHLLDVPNVGVQVDEKVLAAELLKLAVQLAENSTLFPELAGP